MSYLYSSISFIYIKYNKILVKNKSNYAAIARFTRLSNASQHSL